MDLNGEKPSFERLKDMKYLRFVVNEGGKPEPTAPLPCEDVVTDPQ